MKRTWLMCGIAALGAVLVSPQAGAQELVQMRTPQPAGRGAVAQPSTIRVPMEAQVVKGAPYSAEVVTESTQVLADGNRIVRKTTGRVYRDSQGRTRREQDREPGVISTISVSDPVDNASFSLDPTTKTAWKTGFHTAGAILSRTPSRIPPPPAASADPAELERRHKVEASAVVSGGRGGGRGGIVAPLTMAESAWAEKRETLAARNIEGVMAEGTRVTRTIPAGAVGNEQPIVTVTEEWRSPELQVLILTRTSDPRTGESTYRLLSINRSEPNQSWFEVPADYTVRESAYKIEAVRK